MQISIIVITFNRARQLKYCLDALCAQSLAPDSFEIIVVDDGSRDNTSVTVKSFENSCNMKYIFQENKGCGAARNTGIREAAGEILAFIDDDILAPVDWLTNIMTAFKKNPSFDIIQGSVHYRDSRHILLRATQYLSSFADRLRIVESNEFSEGREAVYIGTGNLAIRKNTLLRNDLFFDEILLRREDEDYYRRIKKLGLKVGFIPNSALHDCPFSITSDITRQFNYGRGEYYLRRKWGHYTRIPYKIRLPEIICQLGWPQGIFVKLIIEIRWLFWGIGFVYESLNNCLRQERKNFI